MDTSPVIADERSEQWDAGWEPVAIETVASGDVKTSCPGCVGNSFFGESSAAEISTSFELGKHRRSVSKEHADAIDMSLGNFVEQKFVPEHVADKTPAGRAHFLGMLKHVLTPDRVDRVFGMKPGHGRRNALADWPYLESLHLDDITAERIHTLLSTALQQGYSIQTITHIRNVLRSIFNHAQKTGHFNGKNPATLVVLPAMAHKEASSLTLDQLRQVIQLMRYPVRELAVLALLTEMSVAEICGLKWKYVNLSYDRRRVDGEWLSAKTIAIRKQSYRATLSSAIEPRQRNVPIPSYYVVFCMISKLGKTSLALKILC